MLKAVGTAGPHNLAAASCAAGQHNPAGHMPYMLMSPAYWHMCTLPAPIDLRP
jgi:hypothetical protein